MISAARRETMPFPEDLAEDVATEAKEELTFTRAFAPAGPKTAEGKRGHFDL